MLWRAFCAPGTNNRPAGVAVVVKAYAAAGHAAIKQKTGAKAPAWLHKNGLYGHDVDGAQFACVLGVLLNVIVDLLTLGECFETVGHDAGKMHKDILAAIIVGDKTIAFAFVEPFYCSAVHVEPPKILLLLHGQKITCLRKPKRKHRLTNTCETMSHLEYTLIISALKDNVKQNKKKIGTEEKLCKRNEGRRRPGRCINNKKPPQDGEDFLSQGVFADPQNHVAVTGGGGTAS